jgi:hypothetical protein
LSFTLLLSSFSRFAVSPVHAAVSKLSSGHQVKRMTPHVPGCLPWVVAEKTDGDFVVDLEEDNCNGYYAIAYYNDLRVANFHVYVSGAVKQDAHCDASSGFTNCITPYVSYGGNSNHQICFYGEGGTTTYTDKAFGCVNV